MAKWEVPTKLGPITVEASSAEEAAVKVRSSLQTSAPGAPPKVPGLDTTRPDFINPRTGAQYQENSTPREELLRGASAIGQTATGNPAGGLLSFFSPPPQSLGEAGADVASGLVGKLGGKVMAREAVKNLPTALRTLVGGGVGAAEGEAAGRLRQGMTGEDQSVHPVAAGFGALLGAGTSNIEGLVKNSQVNKIRQFLKEKLGYDAEPGSAQIAGLKPEANLGPASDPLMRQGQLESQGKALGTQNLAELKQQREYAKADLERQTAAQALALTQQKKTLTRDATIQGLDMEKNIKANEQTATKLAAENKRLLGEDAIDKASIDMRGKLAIADARETVKYGDPKHPTYGQALALLDNYDSESIQQNVRKIMSGAGILRAVEEGGEAGAAITKANKGIQATEGNVNTTVRASFDAAKEKTKALADIDAQREALRYTGKQKVQQNDAHFDRLMEKAQSRADTQSTLPSIITDLSTAPDRETFMSKLFEGPSATPSKVQAFYDWSQKTDPRAAEAIGPALTESFIKAAFGPNGDPKRAFGLISSDGQSPDKLAAAFGGGSYGQQTATNVQQFLQDSQVLRDKKGQVMSLLTKYGGPATVAGALVFHPESVLNGKEVAAAGIVLWPKLVKAVVEKPEIGRQFSAWVNKSDAAVTTLKNYPTLLNFIVRNRQSGKAGQDVPTPTEASSASTQ